MQKDRTTGEISFMEVEEIAVYRLYHATNVSSRDELPYTTAFDQLVAAFNLQTNQSNTPHEVWHLVLKVVKQGEAKINKFLGL